MLDPRWRKVARDLVAHKTRTVLVVLSIAVGVFAVAVVMGGRGVLLREFNSDYSASNAPSAEFDTSAFNSSLVKQVEQRSDVRDAEGRRRVLARFTTDASPGEGTTGWDTMTIWAIPDFADMSVQKITREQGATWPPGMGEIVLEQSAQQVGAYAIGDALTVETAAGERAQLTVVGFAHDINAFPAQFVSALTGFVSMETLDLLKEPQEPNKLAIVLEDRGATRAEASRIAVDIRETELEPAGLSVFRTEVPEPGSHFLGDIFKAVSLLLLAMGLFTLALSGFLVVTTISALIAQQVKQVGIMKAVGARRTQVIGMYLVLVAIYGLLAVLIGLPLGLAAGRWFTEYAADILNFRVTDYSPPTYVYGLQIAVGLLVPLMAAMIPVWFGARIPVVRALNTTGVSASFGHGLVDRALGLVRGLPRPVALSLRNTFLRKGRLVLTLTTLALASAVVMSVLSVRASMLQTVDDMSSWWNYDAQAQLARPSPNEIVTREAENIDGVIGVETWVESQASLDRPDGSTNESIFAIGLPPDSRFITPRIVEGRWLSPEDENAVVINTDVAKDEPYLKVGGPMSLKIRGDEREWEIVGIASGQMMGPVAFVRAEDLDAAISAGGDVNRVLVQTAEHSAIAQSRAADSLERRLDDAGVPVGSTQTLAGQSDEIASQLGILVVFLVIMAALLAAVGVIGLTGTMSINVLESTREIGVMRSLGAGHRSIFNIFITEGVVVAVMAWAAGALISWPLSVWLLNALASAMSIPLSYTFSWTGVGLWLAAVLAIAALASLLPAWSASRVSVRDAIAYE